MPTKIWEYEKRYAKTRVGTEIVMVVTNKPGALAVDLIQEIVCDLVLNGNCAFFKVKLPGRKEVIIDAEQYDDLVLKANI